MPVQPQELEEAARRARSRCSRRSRRRTCVGKRQRTFRAGQRLELRITKKGYIGKVVRYKLKKGKIPSGKEPVPADRQEEAAKALLRKPRPLDTSQWSPAD